MPSTRKIMQQRPDQATPAEAKTTLNRSDTVTAPVEKAPGYSFDTALAFLERKGKELYGEHFRVHEEDFPLLYQLMVYMAEDRENAARMGLSLRKGILLTGPVGCGKTSLMTLLRLFRPPQERYRIKSCREVSFAFHREGYQVIEQYSQGTSPDVLGKPSVYLFDDLGTESSLKHYGNTCNVMGEILLSRYDVFVFSGVKTHLTSNLTSSEIEKAYGSRVRSRMREMFNLLSFGNDAKDKRG